MAVKKRRWLRRTRAFLRWHVVSVQTRSGRLADLFLIFVIFAGVMALILESVPDIQRDHERALAITEVVVGTIFVSEYLIRLWVARRKLRFILSFWGVIDLLAILPFLFQGFGLAYLRVFRVLRVFAILKVGQYTYASRILIQSLLASRSKIAVFLLAVLVLVTVLGFLMHGIEPESFPTVPDAMWWVIVTITTVGYGDFVPTTLPGKLVAAGAMITAFGIIAVPTGIVASEYNIARADRRRTPCSGCGREDHDGDAAYCCACGAQL
jgi:voltage-gated potassium channel